MRIAFRALSTLLSESKDRSGLPVKTISDIQEHIEIIGSKGYEQKAKFIQSVTDDLDRCAGMGLLREIMEMADDVSFFHQIKS